MDTQRDERARSALDLVHRIGAAVIGVGIAVFGVLGVANSLAYFSTDGERIAGLSTNGLLSTVSLVTGAVLVLAALRGGRTASTTTTVIGVLFLLAGLAGLLVLDTELNVLAFEIPNVVFSLVTGMVLLFLGLYGRVSGGLPADNPYRRRRAGSPEVEQEDPRRTAELDERIRGEQAVAEGTATAEQERVVREDRQRRSTEARRRATERSRQQRG